MGVPWVAHIFLCWVCPGYELHGEARTCRWAHTVLSLKMIGCCFFFHDSQSCWTWARLWHYCIGSHPLTMLDHRLTASWRFQIDVFQFCRSQSSHASLLVGRLGIGSPPFYQVVATLWLVRMEEGLSPYIPVYFRCTSSYLRARLKPLLAILPTFPHISQSLWVTQLTSIVSLPSYCAHRTSTITSMVAATASQGLQRGTPGI